MRPGWGGLAANVGECGSKRRIDRLCSLVTVMQIFFGFSGENPTQFAIYLIKSGCSLSLSHVVLCCSLSAFPKFQNPKLAIVLVISQLILLIVLQWDLISKFF